MYYLGTCLEGLRKTSMSIAGLEVLVRTQDFPYTQQEGYPLDDDVRL
jgi:hypothetical protein